MRAPVLLLCLALLCGLVSAFAQSPVSLAGHELVSPRLQSILQLDREYVATLAEEEAQRAAQGLPPLVPEPASELSAIPSNAPYNYATATKLFWHSVSAYCLADAQLSSWKCPSCAKFGSFSVTSVLSQSSNQGYTGYFTQGLPSSPMPGVAANAPLALVSFRGSANINNWIDNISFGKTSPYSAHKSAALHSGFWSAYNNLKAGMISGLQTAISKSGAKAIILTGHSLGCAIAQLAALDLKLNPSFSALKIGVYGQGCPRVGDANYAALYASKVDVTFREVRQADVVAHLPPVLMGFRHGPTEMWFNSNMDKYTYCNGKHPNEDPKCSNSIAVPISVSDHTTYRGIGMGSWCKSNAKLFAMPEHEAAELSAEELGQLIAEDMALEQFEAETRVEVQVAEPAQTEPVSEPQEPLVTAPEAEAAQPAVRRPVRKIRLTEH